MEKKKESKNDFEVLFLNRVTGTLKKFQQRNKKILTNMEDTSHFAGEVSQSSQGQSSTSQCISPFIFNLIVSFIQSLAYQF